MPYTRDFDLIIPKNAVYLPPDEILPGLRGHLHAVGIEHPERYEHFQIRIIIRPRTAVQDGESQITALFRTRFRMSRKQKRRAFSSVDSVFIALSTPDAQVVMREAFPPTTNRDGQPELALGADISVGADVAMSGVKASAKIHAKFKKKFRFQKHLVCVQRSERTAIWDFKKWWFQDGHQPEVCITVSIPETLPMEKRFVRCMPRVTAGGRAVIAPKRSKRINLRIP